MMIAALALMAALAADGTISGVVHDSTGGVVSGAAVVVRVGGAEHRATTGPDGRFTVDAPETGQLTVIVRAGGFAEKTTQVPPAHTGDLDVVLEPATLLETVTVTPTRSEQRLGDIPASVNVVTSEEIEASPALVADDVLRQVPTFSLFRRTSSLVAQPTTQGVSLRGIGPSGQSRTLVLLDGIPFNDPFGGWVYWTRVPLDSVDRIEVTDGPTSSLYGNYAMGGVINIITTRPTRADARAQAAVRHRGQPEVRLPGGRPVEQAGRARRRQLLQDRRLPHRRAERARADRQQRRRRLPATSAPRSSTRRPTASTRSSAAATSARIGTTARSASSTTRGGRR